MNLSNKSSARLLTIQLLYAQDIDKQVGYDKLRQDLISYYHSQNKEGKRIKLPNQEFLKQLSDYVMSQQAIIDDIIAKYLNKYWTIDKLSILLKAILRCGIAEMIYMKDIPTKVTINEYVTIASSFFDKKETGFVNSILDKISLEFRENNHE